MVSHDGGSRNLVSVTKGYEALSKVWSRKLIVEFVSKNGGSKRIYDQLKLLDASDLVVLWSAIDPEISSIIVEESSNSYSMM